MVPYQPFVDCLRCIFAIAAATPGQPLAIGGRAELAPSSRSCAIAFLTSRPAADGSEGQRTVLSKLWRPIAQLRRGLDRCFLIFDDLHWAD